MSGTTELQSIVLPRDYAERLDAKAILAAVHAEAFTEEVATATTGHSTLYAIETGLLRGLVKELAWRCNVLADRLEQAERNGVEDSDTPPAGLITGPDIYADSPTSDDEREAARQAAFGAAVANFELPEDKEDDAVLNLANLVAFNVA